VTHGRCDRWRHLFVLLLAFESLVKLGHQGTECESKDALHMVPLWPSIKFSDRRGTAGGELNKQQPVLSKKCPLLSQVEQVVSGDSAA